MKLTLPFWLENALRKFRISISESTLNKLREKHGERCLLLSNHPAQWDPWVMVELSKQLEENFFYVVAREVFDWYFGLQGRILQWMGSYSVIRGAADKDSFKMTKTILTQNKGRLVVFVEGEISNRNDSMLPLEPGVLQLGFLALQDLYRQNGRKLDALPSLYVFPIAIKYFYKAKGLNETIENALQILERATGLESKNLSQVDRIHALSRLVLQEAIRQYDYTAPKDTEIKSQTLGLENFMLDRLEHEVNLPFDESMTYLERVRRIRNTIDRVLKDVPDSQTDYQERMHNHRKSLLKNFYWDLERIVNFVAIFDGYMQPDMTPEHCVEVIRRLEKEIFGAYHLRHPRTAVVQAMDPIDLRDHFIDYLKDRRKTTENLTAVIEQSIYTGIRSARLPAKTKLIQAARQILLGSIS